MMRDGMGTKGFTTSEIVIVIVVAVIMIGVAMPSFLGTIQRSRLGGATRDLVAQIRTAQSMAVTRSGVFGLHWGGDPAAGRLDSEYRIEQDPGGACAWPAPTDTPSSNVNVVTDWTDLSREYPGVTITSIRDNSAPFPNNPGGVIFNSRGLSVNTCVGVTFPVTVTIADNSGATEMIQINRAGSVTIQ